MDTYLESILSVASKYKDLAPWVGTIAALIASLVAAQAILKNTGFRSEEVNCTDSSNNPKIWLKKMSSQ